MSRFYADLNNGAVTRTGHKNIAGHIRGWGLGVEVQGEIDENGNDVFLIYLTTGSSTTRNASRYLGKVHGDMQFEINPGFPLDKSPEVG